MGGERDFYRDGRDAERESGRDGPGEPDRGAGEPGRGDTSDAVGAVVRDDMCFCCGKDNDRGLKLDFSYTRPGVAKTTLHIPEWFSGWQRMTHGGLLSMLLDECMAHACISLHGHAITAELTVRYHAPVEVGSKVIVQAEAGETRARIIDTTGTITNRAGGKIASARAKFMLPKHPTNS